MNRLLIVESPGKLKTLRGILGKGWRVEASVGHVTELGSDGPRRLGFELKDGKVVTHYVPRGDRGREVLAKLRKVAADAEIVYLATDPDREGEAIAWHLAQQLKLKRYHRVAYTQITEAAVKRAIENPGKLDTPLIESQRARQCLDKLVGYEVSPLLWSSTGGRSAGRVQSATLHLVCERERERLAFKPEDFWTLKSRYREGFEASYVNPPKAGELSSKEGELSNDEWKSRVRTKEEAARIEAIARANPHVVESVESKIDPRTPPAPLITSSLQQVAGAKFKFAPKHTMKVAQELYEGIGGKGVITYMRTDSTALAPEFVEETRAWLRQAAPECLPEKPTTFRAKAEAQGAHEAIRPTDVTLTPELARAKLSPDQLKLYTLIWERAVASQCKPARLSKTKITVLAGDTRWEARGAVVVEIGYLKFWRNIEDEKLLPPVAKSATLGLEDVKTSQSATTPPPRYSEARLVQLMERKGIGRPSTYASTIATLKDRDYVVLEQGAVAPTALGMATDEALAKSIPELVDTEFTARMESSLDAIAEGKVAWETYLCDWNASYFTPALAKAREAIKGFARVADGTSGPRAPGARGASGGKFARSTAAAPPIAEVREKLAQATLKAQKSGTQPSCPKSHGLLVLRLSKRQKFYWKCLFPECDAVSWYQELSREKCPACGAALEKVPSKKVSGGYFLKCAGRPVAHEEVLFFKSRKTKEWEQAKGPRPAATPQLSLPADPA